jgi:myosin heavy subunit
MANGKFSIHHYAGPVEYDTNGFLEKNKDELPKEIDDLLHSSNNEFLRSLTNEMSNAESEDDKPSFSKSSLKRITVGGQFSAQLQLLRTRIDATSPHYIRCLKPNDKLEPDNFDSAIIADQLRCAGILEAVRVSRVGYPQRYLHARFVQRYQCLAMKELQLRRKDASSSFSSPVGFGFNGGFVPKNHTKSHRSMNSSPKCGKSHQQREEKRLSSDQECKILVSCIARELMADKKDDNEDIYNSKPTKWSSPSKSSRYAPMILKKKHELDLLAIGIQLGKTKVFLRQHAFEALEVLRRKIQNEAATVLNSVFRMYMKRRRYIVIRNEYRARVAQRSRMIAEGGVVGSHEEFYFDAVNASFESANQFDFKAGDEKISFHREEEYRSCKNFKWIMVDNRWMKNGEDEEGSDDEEIKN